MRILHYAGFDILGEQELEAYAVRHPGRVSRLIDAVERFIEIGPGVGSLLYSPTRDGSEAVLGVYLVPPRAILRGVPDMGGVVLVDRSAKLIRLVEVIEEYGGDDDRQWRDLCERAARWATGQETSNVRKGR